MWLSYGSGDGETILDYRVGSNVITGVFTSGRQGVQSQKVYSEVWSSFKWWRKKLLGATELVRCSTIIIKINEESERKVFSPLSLTIPIFNKSSYIKLVYLSSIHLHSFKKRAPSILVRTFTSFSLPDQNNWVGKCAVFKKSSIVQWLAHLSGIIGCLPLKKALGYRMLSHILLDNLWPWILNYLDYSREPLHNSDYNNFVVKCTKWLPTGTLFSPLRYPGYSFG